jgi:hypothetical protein
MISRREFAVFRTAWVRLGTTKPQPAPVEAILYLTTIAYLFTTGVDKRWKISR